MSDIASDNDHVTKKELIRRLLVQNPDISNKDLTEKAKTTRGNARRARSELKKEKQTIRISGDKRPKSSPSGELVILETHSLLEPEALTPKGRKKLWKSFLRHMKPVIGGISFGYPARVLEEEWTGFLWAMKFDIYAIQTFLIQNIDLLADKLKEYESDLWHDYQRIREECMTSPIPTTTRITRLIEILGEARTYEGAEYGREHASAAS